MIDEGPLRERIAKVLATYATSAYSDTGSHCVASGANWTTDFSHSEAANFRTLAARVMDELRGEDTTELKAKLQACIQVITTVLNNGEYVEIDDDVSASLEQVGIIQWHTAGDDTSGLYFESAAYLEPGDRYWQTTPLWEEFRSLAGEALPPPEVSP